MYFNMTVPPELKSAPALEPRVDQCAISQPAFVDEPRKATNAAISIARAASASKKIVVW